MSVNNIKDIKNVDSENFDYLLAESNFRIESVFRQRVKKTTEPNVPIITSITNLPSATPTKTQIEAFADPDNSKTKTGGTFDFVMNASENGLIDLRDGEFIIQAQYAYTDTTGVNNKEGFINAPVFGNQALLSMFQQITLFIDDTEVQCNKWPGMSSNAEYALRYPHCKTLEENYEIHGFQRTIKDKYAVEVIDSGNINQSIANVEASFTNPSITLKIYRVAPDTNVPAYYLYTGFITQRIKMADIFSVVETLPPLYNHRVNIRFQRTPNNDIICNTATYSGAICKCLGFMKFKLQQDVYITTDQFIGTAKKYYSKPIETIITQDKQYFQPIVAEPGANNTQEFNINIDTAYKNKLLTIAIPRTTNFAYQANCAAQYYDLDTNTNPGQPIYRILTNDKYHQFNNSNFGDPYSHYDSLKAPANSYTYGGLRQLIVESVASGIKYYTFDMENDGVVKSQHGEISKFSIKSNCNFSGVSNAISIANYEDVYKQYVKARLHFQQEEDEALDFDTFIKEYCIYCVDLSPFDITPGDSIKITMTFSAWEGDYNPYYAYNSKINVIKCSDTNHTYLPVGTYSIPARYTSTNIICNLFCDKILRLLPNREIQLADMISTSSVEVENSQMA